MDTKSFTLKVVINDRFDIIINYFLLSDNLERMRYSSLIRDK